MKKTTKILHRKVVQEAEEQIVTIPEALVPVFDSIGKAVLALQKGVNEALAPAMPVLIQIAEAMEKARRRNQPRKKPAHTVRTMHMASVRRRMFAYRRTRRQRV